MQHINVLPQVGFAEASKNVFKKMFQFTGRIRRSEYWWGVLAIFIASLVLTIISAFPFIGWVGSIAMVFVSIAGVSLTFRRLHDTGRSGWWWGLTALCAIAIFAIIIGTADWASLADAENDEEVMDLLATGLTDKPAMALAIVVLYAVTFIIEIVIFVFTLLDSKPGDNKYGAATKYIVTDDNPQPAAENAPEQWTLK